jgi:hypothetical protein
MSRAVAIWIAALLALTLGGCGAGWRRVDDLSPRVMPVRAQVQLWMGHRIRVLHPLAQTDDVPGYEIYVTSTDGSGAVLEGV